MLIGARAGGRRLTGAAWRSCGGYFGGDIVAHVTSEIHYGPTTAMHLDGEFKHCSDAFYFIDTARQELTV